MNPAGDGGPTSTAATSKNPGDLDSAIDQGLLCLRGPPLGPATCAQFHGVALANSADPFHHDNSGCSCQRPVHRVTLAAGILKISKLSLLRVSENTFKKPNQR